MIAGDRCNVCLVGTLEKSDTVGRLTCNNCSTYFEDAEKGVERSSARVTDPAGNEHKIEFIKVGDYWEID